MSGSSRPTAMRVRVLHKCFMHSYNIVYAKLYAKHGSTARHSSTARQLDSSTARQTSTATRRPGTWSQPRQAGARQAGRQELDRNSTGSTAPRQRLDSASTEPRQLDSSTARAQLRAQRRSRPDPTGISSAHRSSTRALAHAPDRSHRRPGAVLHCRTV